MTIPSGLRIVLTCILAAATPAHAADGAVVEATGEAQIRNNDTVAAKNAATADALKRCIEKVVGIQIQSEFTAEQRELVKNNQSEFYSAVRDSLTQKSEGFIESYEVTNEAQKGDVLAISVRARVFESKIKAKAMELAELIAKAGNPRLMLIIQEVYINHATGRRKVARESVVAAYLEKELLARGFELRGAKQAKDIGDDSPEAYDKWLDNVGGAAKVARDQGADILLAGRVEITNKGVIDDTAGLDALKGQIKIEINSVVRGINAASGDVFSTKPVLMSSIGTNEERALHRALQGRGNNAINQTFEQLLADLKTSFRKTAEQGQSYVVHLKGVTSFRKQGQPFFDAIKGIAGVSSVKQQSFDGGILVVDVTFKGALNELQQKIFTAAEKKEGFGTLDVEGISGKQISLKL